MSPEQVDVARDLAVLRRAVRAFERFCRKKAWRRAVLLRATRTSLVLKSVEGAIGDRYVRREKAPDRRWHVYARGEAGAEVLVALVGGGATRRLDEIRAPVRVEVVAPCFIDLERLRRTTDRRQQGMAEAT